MFPALLIYLSICLNIFTLLSYIQSVDNMFHSFENEYFLIFNLHCSFTNVILCTLVCRALLSEKIFNISIIIFIPIQYPKNFALISS